MKNQRNVGQNGQNGQMSEMSAETLSKKIGQNGHGYVNTRAVAVFFCGFLKKDIYKKCNIQYNDNMRMKVVYVKNGETVTPLLKNASRKTGEKMSEMIERLIIQEYERTIDFPEPKPKEKKADPREVAISLLTENKKMPAREFHRVLIERTGVSQKTVTRLKLKMIQENIIGKEKQSIFLKGNP